jgi:outer membrane protein assembly factor BamB
MSKKAMLLLTTLFIWGICLLLLGCPSPGGQASTPTPSPPTWKTIGTQGSGTNQFISPRDVALDGSGYIYVADSSNNRIVRMNDMNGTGWTSFGSTGSGTNQFISPCGVAVDVSGHIYVADQLNYRIVCFVMP